MTKQEVDDLTQRARRRVARAISIGTRAQQDSHKVDRLKACLCKLCFYVHAERIGGAAMTTSPCGICAEDMIFGSTNTNALCIKCAKEHDLCAQCGADRELRPMRRKFAWLTEGGAA